MINKILFFLFTCTCLIAKEPSWLYNIKSSKNEIIGYGTDGDLHIAKQKALSDIAETINVSIKSNIQSSEQVSNDEFSSNVSMNIDSSSKANLLGTKVLKSQKVDKLWYVAVSYDKTPFTIKMKNALSKLTLKNEKQNPFLSNSVLFQRLNKEVGFTLDYQVVRHNSLWHLKYKDILIPLNTNYFTKLFSSKDSKSFSFGTNKKVFYPNDKMFFSINFNQPGYLSILYVESNGKVGVLLKNKKLHKSMVFPDPESDEEFVVANPYKETIIEMYIALYSKTRLDLSLFELVDNSYLDESTYNFTSLVEKLKNIEFSSEVIKIRN